MTTAAAFAARVFDVLKGHKHPTQSDLLLGFLGLLTVLAIGPFYSNHIGGMLLAATATLVGFLVRRHLLLFVFIIVACDIAFKVSANLIRGDADLQFEVFGLLSVFVFLILGAVRGGQLSATENNNLQRDIEDENSAESEPDMADHGAQLPSHSDMSLDTVLEYLGRRGAQRKGFRLAFGWRDFQLFRRAILQNPNTASVLARDRKFSPLAFKLSETFFAGLPAVFLGIAFTVMEMLPQLFSDLSSQQLIYWGYFALDDLASSVIDGFTVPASLLIMAAICTWPLAINRAPKAENGLGRRLYMTMDGARGLYTQSLAGLAYVCIDQSIALSDVGADDIGVLLVWFGSGLLILAAPFFLYLNIYKIPKFVLTTLGTKKFGGMIGRLVAHYGIAGLAAYIVTGLTILLEFIRVYTGASLFLFA